jgi:stage III sporulation protein AA
MKQEMMPMNCAWKELLSILPISMREDVNFVGKDTLQEIRMRLGNPPELICSGGSRELSKKMDLFDLQFVINTASRYSPWLAGTLSQGYLTAPGGHRIGVCGEAIVKNGLMTGIKNPSSLCIRIARDFPGMINDRNVLEGSVLIIGQPGSGKTTFLRDLIRLRSNRSTGSVAVVDERGEIFPAASGFAWGRRTDVLTGCSKREGMEALLRTMGPETIAVDEITSATDCEGLLHAAWCGVSLIATAHASSRYDLCSRPVYRPLIDAKIFDMLVILQKDKSWKIERMEHK